MVETQFKEKLMCNLIKSVVGVLMLVAGASMSGTWCGVDCPEEDSYVTIESCPPGQVQDGYTMKRVTEWECLDVDTCTGSYIMVCVACLKTTYTIAEPNCVFRIDFPDIPDPFPSDYGG